MKEAKESPKQVTSPVSTSWGLWYDFLGPTVSSSTILPGGHTMSAPTASGEQLIGYGSRLQIVHISVFCNNYRSHKNSVSTWSTLFDVQNWLGKVSTLGKDQKNSIHGSRKHWNEREENHRLEFSKQKYPLQRKINSNSRWRQHKHNSCVTYVVSFVASYEQEHDWLP